ncbi:hypothetical protein DIS24_g1237 [Lasiodiplodia hormozganensis]|uniref:Uncharacterized protein n=2 Tax=Lasiodiplodia TaxID=66739 RepID=A0A5N5DJN0_9PEZI|nr:hypothetical protein DBV05_g3231 [Lasiodiplodia theobromae]KAK0663336.1 hypothetical protein DIS24_g1237 [Lasiodiplodia hormozganensis]
MEKPPGKTESTDGSSIKPVSSLRSHFENMLNRQSSTSSDPPRPMNARPSLGNIFDGPDESRARADGRMSLDLPRPHIKANFHVPAVSAKLAAQVPDKISACRHRQSS